MISAILRIFIWKTIRTFKISTYRYKIWDNRKINLHFNSVQSAWLMFNYWIDWEEFNFIKNYVKPGDVVIDVGANIGTYVLWTSKFIGKSGKIHAFEPDPKNFARLEENIKLNQLQRLVQANCLGIAEKNSLQHFSVGLDVQNQILNSSSEGNSQMISCISLDNYALEQNLTRIRYLKIDIEGYEYSALKGASDLLSSGKIDYIQLEINEKIINSDITPRDLIEYMNTNNYVLCTYNSNKNQLERINYHRNKENYFFCKTPEHTH